MNKRSLALLAFALLVFGGLAYAGSKVRELQHQVHAAQLLK